MLRKFGKMMVHEMLENTLDLGLRLDYYMLLHRWMWIDCILLIASAEHNRLTHKPPTSSLVATATLAGRAMCWMPVGFHVR